MQKKRLDTLLVEKKLVDTVESARALIGAGQVIVEGQEEDKAGSRFRENSRVKLKEQQPYVSRGGLKVEKGLAHFGIEPTGMICADIGCSTGGFTDCLLQHGAKTIYAGYFSFN